MSLNSDLISKLDYYNKLINAIETDENSLKYIPFNLLNNYHFIMKAVKNNGFALQYASLELSNNYDIVIEAVRNKGRSIYYATPKLKNNYNIAIEAIKNDITSFMCVSLRLLYNLKFILEVIIQLFDQYCALYNNAIDLNTDINGILKHTSSYLKIKFDNIFKLIDVKHIIYFQKDFRMKKDLIINNQYCRKHFIFVLLCIQKIFKNQFKIIIPLLCIEKIYKYIDILDLKPFIESLKEK